MKITILTWEEFAYSIFAQPEMWDNLWNGYDDWIYYYWTQRN